MMLTNVTCFKIRQVNELREFVLLNVNVTIRFRSDNSQLISLSVTLSLHALILIVEVVSEHPGEFLGYVIQNTKYAVMDTPLIWCLT